MLRFLQSWNENMSVILFNFYGYYFKVQPNFKSYSTCLLLYNNSKRDLKMFGVEKNKQRHIIQPVT